MEDKVYRFEKETVYIHIGQLINTSNFTSHLQGIKCSLLALLHTCTHALLDTQRQTIKKIEAGEMAHQLRALAVLQKSRIQFPAPIRYLTTSCNSSFKRIRCPVLSLV